ncbi:MAG TPA: hypothetical protein VLH18_05850, partial [Candidatus Limnocylindrales bacterium]|nr:hypothetical protein [Candidatus Limnocylindrales bacterium]
MNIPGVPESIKKPGFYFAITSQRSGGLIANAQKAVILAPKIAAGTGVAGNIYDAYDQADAAKYCGYGSVGHLLAKRALSVNRYMFLQLMIVADAGAAVAGTCHVVVTGTATKAGVLSVNIGDQTVDVAFATGDLHTAISAALEDLISPGVGETILYPALPVTAVDTAGNVLLTSKNKGAYVNDIKVSATVTESAGITVVVNDGADPVTHLSGGATNPTLDGVGGPLEKLFNAGHTIIINPYNDEASIKDVDAHVKAVGGPLEKRWAKACFGYTDASGTSSAFTTLCGNVNSKETCGVYFPGIKTPSFELAAVHGALWAAKEDPALPIDGTTILALDIPANPNDYLKGTVIETILANGGCPYEVGPGNVARVVRDIMTYVSNADGVADISPFDTTITDVGHYAGKYFLTVISSKFSGTNKKFIRSRTPKAVKSVLLVAAKEMETAEFIQDVDSSYK